MYLIVASQVDEQAKELKSHLREDNARIMSPSDLSRPGWHIRNRRPDTSQFVAEDEIHSVEQLQGVICLLPLIYHAELVQITEEARSYVAGEMNAFLRYWLSTLNCPMLNPPTSGSLSGPNWRQEQWLSAARKCGLRTVHLSRSSNTSRAQLDTDTNGARLNVTLIGDSCLETVEPDILDSTRKLANFSGTPMLSATFLDDAEGHQALAHVNSFPRLPAQVAAPLIERYFSITGRGQT